MRSNETSAAVLAQAELERARRTDTRGKRMLIAGLVIMLAAALFPVFASWALDGEAATALWLASMPLCLAGAALAAVGYTRRRSVSSLLREDWG
ncbi:MAG: hypothetical protein SO046_10505 [Actinomyces urogenitalis]|uniref:hypothetical protein n=1 Tax=Actinomyces urogenitalis TaxID=103621 RepID=UPI002A7F59E1|nr:hypothetical protein [Actinomyces urogenitalis]MDY3679625.1 hypothetical protein [Actinomyces urogenitalis]